MEPSPEPAGPRVLLADDEPHIRRLLRTFLEEAGFRVTAVADGGEALRVLQGPEPLEMILLDIMMPVKSGLQVLESLRRLPHRNDTPVVILTAKGQDADRERAFLLGATEFVTKPFSPRKLLALLQQLLGEGRN